LRTYLNVRTIRGSLGDCSLLSFGRNAQLIRPLFMPALTISASFFSFAHIKGTAPCHIVLWKAPAMMRTLFSTAATGTVRLHFSPCSTF
jgi:hypothetical protein